MAGNISTGPGGLGRGYDFGKGESRVVAKVRGSCENRGATMSTLDVLVCIPLIPAIPVIATWFLPWEKWIPKAIPKTIIGPYLFYCAFATWYFKQGWWFVGLLAIWAGIVSIMAVRERKAPCA